MNSKDRLLIFRDDRINVKNGYLYTIIKENNENLVINGTNNIACFFKVEENDNKIMEEIDLYNGPLGSVVQVTGLDNIKQLLFDKEIKTLTYLAEILVNNDFKILPEYTYLLTDYYLYSKTSYVKIKENDNNGYTILNGTSNFDIYPIFSIVQRRLYKNKVVNDILSVLNFPDGLTLLKDTNPERNALPESI